MAGTFLNLIKLIRYRFLLIAGLFPYGLGVAVAFYIEKRFDLSLFLMGFGATLLALIGVEAFNEYFDWQIGTDRIFQQDPKPVTPFTLSIGIVSFLIALIVAILLAQRLGIMIIAFYIAGLLAALFYLAPPVKLSYRGLGEVLISFSYGPLLVLAGYYIQTQRIDTLPLFVSVIPALQLFLLSILNQVPDYLQDKLAGKRNICVRIGKKNVLRLSKRVSVFFYSIILAGLLVGKFPKFSSLALICLPVSLINCNAGMRMDDNPHHFIPVIRYMVVSYIIIMILLITGYVVEGFSY